MATMVRLYELKCLASSCDRGDGAHYKTPKLESGPAVELMKKHMAAHHPPAALPTSLSCTTLTDNMKLPVIQSIAAKDFYGLPTKSLPVGIKVKVNRKSSEEAESPPGRQKIPLSSEEAALKTSDEVALKSSEETALKSSRQEEASLKSSEEAESPLRRQNILRGGRKSSEVASLKTETM